MKFHHLIIAILTLVFSTQAALAQSEIKTVKITVFKSVLETADWANFKYKEELKDVKSFWKQSNSGAR